MITGNFRSSNVMMLTAWWMTDDKTITLIHLKSPVCKAPA